MDEAFVPLAGVIETLMDFRTDFQDTEAGVRLYMRGCEMELPIELDVTRDAAGALALGTTPPLYALQTTVAPSMHRLRFVVEEARDGDD